MNARLLFALVAFAQSAHVFAQSAADPSKAAVSPPSLLSLAKPYQDKVIEGLAPIEEQIDTREEARSLEGWPRSVTLQLTRNIQTTDRGTGGTGSTGQSANSKTRTDVQGLQLDANMETPDYGAFAVNLLALGGRSATGLTSWSVRQIGLPFDGGWRLDNALGVTNILLPDLARRSSRLAISAPQVLGGSMLLRNVNQDALSIGLSAGEPGQFEGFPQSRFVGVSGQVASVQLQMKQRDWMLGAVAAMGNNILGDGQFPQTSQFLSDGAPQTPRIDTRGFYISALNEALLPKLSLQVSVIATALTTASAALVNASNPNRRATGIWADAIWREGGARHQASLFRFTPDLRWIERPLASDLQGASYRYDYNPLRWDISTNVEVFDSVSGNQPGGWFGNLNARWRLSSGVTTGGGAAVRHVGSTSASAFGYVQWRNALGNTRVQIDLNGAAGGQRTEALSVEHALVDMGALSLSMSLSMERVKLAPEPLSNISRPRENAFSVGLNGRAELSANLFLQSSVRARQAMQSALGSVSETINQPPSTRGTALSASVGLDWTISRDWTFGMSYYENRGAIIETLAVQSPLAPPEIIRVRPNDRGIFLSLRYTGRAGTTTAPLGGAPGSGAGRLTGTIYLDSNSNQMRDANENGAANVLVTLDGKYTTRTNSLGGFEFSHVVAGAHTITVLQDDLPLPWALDSEAKFPVSISTRSTTQIDIGAKRIQ